MLTELSYAVSGFALLLFSMKHLTLSLDREIVKYLGKGLQRVTRSPGSALLAGLGTTLVVQASSVTVLTAMGFLSRGLLTLDRAILIMLGAALGSAIKGWYATEFLAWVGPALLLFGVLGWIAASGQRTRRLFEVIISIGMTFLGLALIEAGLSPFAQSALVPELSGGVANFSILKTVFFGAFAAVILQSSSSVFFLVIHFATQGLISVPAAIGLILGANLGTTSTPLVVSAWQESFDSKRLALSYCIVKLSAVVLVLIYFRTHAALVEDFATYFGLVKRPDIVIVAFHTWFNLMNALTWWLLLPLLLRIVCGLVPGKESAVGTSPFSGKIQRLLSNLPGRAVSEGANKLQQVIRDLHWVSDGVFYGIEGRGSRVQCAKVLEESLKRCEKSGEVLNTVREVTARSLKALVGQGPFESSSRARLLNLILLTADLKNIECILYSCIQSLTNREKLSNPVVLLQFRELREKLNVSWEKMYSLERYQQSMMMESDVDVQLLEVSLRLGTVQRLMESEIEELIVQQQAPSNAEECIGMVTIVTETRSDVTQLL